MIGSALRRTSVSGLAVLALTLGSSVGAVAGAPASVSIEGKAAFQNAAAITVVVNANCGAAASVGNVTVGVSQGTATGNATGFGSRPFTSDGTRQKVAVTVGGGLWNVGEAVAFATLSCGGLFVDQELNVRITIVQ